MKSKIDIVLTSSDFYAPYTAVTMASILENSPQNRSIHFHIISEDFSEKNKEKMSQLNSIKDFDIEYKKVSCKDLDLPIAPQARVSNIAYARMRVATLFPNITRCIICDSDLVFNHDISELYDIDLEDKAIAIAQDPLLRGENRWWEFLDVPHECPYLNSGVMLMDVAQFRMQGYENKLFENYHKYKEKLSFIDQDLFYITCSECNKLIDSRWNFLPNVYYSDPSLKEQLYSTSYVYHYGGGRKPWIWTNVDKAEIWWKYARKTPFYEEILERLMNDKANIVLKQVLEVKLGLRYAYVCAHPIYYKLKKYRYRLLKHLTFGVRRKKYRLKYRGLKRLLKDVDLFQKNLKKEIK